MVIGGAHSKPSSKNSKQRVLVGVAGQDTGVTFQRCVTTAGAIMVGHARLRKTQLFATVPMLGQVRDAKPKSTDAAVPMVTRRLVYTVQWMGLLHVRGANQDTF